MRALLGTASHFCEVVVLKLRTVPPGTALSLRTLRVIRRCAQAMYKHGAAAIFLGGEWDVDFGQLILCAFGEVTGC